MVERTQYYWPDENKDSNDRLQRYPDAVRVEYDDYVQLYISAQWAGSQGAEVPDDIEKQTHLTMKNIENIVEANGGVIGDVTRVHVYVLGFSQHNFRRIHEARAKFFQGKYAPTSTLVEVPGLPYEGARIAIEAEAVIAK
jgi:enamine deaminase RidA (YjgF/YER057c/UK114 family)